MKGTTSSGFEFNVSDKIGSDYRLQKVITSYEKGSETDKLCSLVEMVKVLLGDDGEAALCEHVKEEDGTVPIQRITQEVVEIFNLAKAELKNS
jgi:hypothetical protein